MTGKDKSTLILQTLDCEMSCSSEHLWAVKLHMVWALGIFPQDVSSKKGRRALLLQPVVASQSAYISGILRLPRSSSGSIIYVEEQREASIQCIYLHGQTKKRWLLVATTKWTNEFVSQCHLYVGSQSSTRTCISPSLMSSSQEARNPRDSRTRLA